MTTQIKKWACGRVYIKGEYTYIVREITVTEKPKTYLVDRAFTTGDVASMLGHKTHINKLDKILFDTADEAVKNAIGDAEREVNKLTDKLNKAEAELVQLEGLLSPSCVS
jgi:hypothetical protein